MDFVAIDIETTGFSHKYDTILQIACVKIIDNKVAGEFNKYIHTTKKVPQSVTEICGITNDLLNKKGEPYTKVLTDFMDFIGNMDIFAHNATFDTRFIKQKVDMKLNRQLNNNVFCTYQTARKKFPSLPNHKLDTVATHLGIPNIRHHDAINDARVCADIALVICGHNIVATKPKNKIVSIINSMRLTGKNNRFDF